MKKIILCFCTLVLLFSLSVPCFAADEYTISSGSYVFNPPDNFSGFDVRTYVKLDFDFTTNVEIVSTHDFNRMLFSATDTVGGKYPLSVGFRRAEDSVLEYIWQSNTGFSKDYGEIIITVPSPVSVSYDAFNIFTMLFSSYDTVTPEITFSKYNYCKLPDINSVWTDHDTYKAAAIIRIKESGTYRLIIGNNWINNYLYTEQYNGNDVEAYFLMGTDCMMYDLVGDVWTYVSTSSSGMYVRTATSDLVWSNTLLYDDYTKEFAYTHFFSQPRLTTVTTPRILSGVMVEMVKIAPMCLALLVGYAALRKALAILRQILSQA